MEARKSVIKYEQDSYGWALETAQLLREGRIADIDLENVAEEIEDMGKAQRRSLVSLIVQILVHMLKVEYQPGRDCRSWRLSIIEHRTRLGPIFEESPSLTLFMESAVQQAYKRARLIAARQTGLELDVFPVECPWSVTEVAEDQE